MTFETFIYYFGALSFAVAIAWGSFALVNLVEKWAARK